MSMHHAVMRICIFHRFPLYVPKNGFLGGFDGEDVKILYSDPPKCTTPREYASLDVRRVKICSTA